MNRFCGLFFLFQPFFLFAQPSEANLLGRWEDSTLMGSGAYDNTYNEVWGFAVNGHEYGVIGSTFGTHFIDVTDPRNPFERFRIAGKAQGRQIIHRHFHDFKGYLYGVCDEGQSSLQIMDISKLPDTVTLEYNSGDLITRAHNIFIDSTNSRLYAFSTAGELHGFSKMVLLDISNPLVPKFLNRYDRFGGLNPSHIHDGYVRDNVAFLNAETKGLAIVDYSDPLNPVDVGILPSNAYSQSGYNHSGWATTDCQYYVMADETWGMDLKMVDLRNKPDLEVAAYFDADAIASTSIPHNQIVACDYLYVAYYYDGLQVFDISDPHNPFRVRYFDTCTEPDDQNYKGAWGVYPFLPSGKILLSDMQNGLFIFEGMGDNCRADANLKPCNLTTSVFSNSKPSEGFKMVIKNPGQDGEVQLTFYSSEKQENLILEMVDLGGKVVMRQAGLQVMEGKSSLVLPVSPGLATGVYFLKISNEAIFSIEKMIIRH